ncbi:FAD-dependent monooxygenase [Planktotalea sp.]|uniref:FAD-dependent monooxygenase n=1 Tax=Planktotalea sp. TaxID=2029877 RepID=UPI0025E0D75A|nr:FAD-dependent monooxygenase [Planktotalea sp.]
MKITVVGGGIGGLAVATALAQQSVQVVVLEQASAISEVGAGLQISPNGLCVLRALGLEKALARRSCRGHAVSLRRSESDVEVARLDLTRLEATQRYHFLHRADLIDMLLNAATNAGVDVRTSQKVSSIEPAIPTVVHLADGSELTSDLVIDASGLHSTLRGVLNDEADPFFTGQVAWRAIIPNTIMRKNAVHVHMAPRSHIVSYPIRDGAFLNLVAVQERDQWAPEGWSQRDDPKNLRSAFQGAAPVVQQMLEQVQDVHLWGLFRHRVAANWAGAGCVLLGDAAHPTLPFLAQGANTALEDAWALAACLACDGAIEAKLAAYQNLRKLRVTKVIEASNNNAWRYHLRRGPVRLAAHIALGLGSRFAPNLMLGQFDWLYGYDITSVTPEI